MYIIYLFLILFSFTAIASNNENLQEQTQNNENTQTTSNTSIVEENTNSTLQLQNSPQIQQVEVLKKWEDIKNKNAFPLMDGEFLLEKNQKHFLVYENPNTVKAFKGEKEETKKLLSGRIQLQYPCVLKESTGFENIKICHQKRKEENSSVSEIRSITPGNIFILIYMHKMPPFKNTLENENISLPDVFTPYFNWIGDEATITFAKYMDLLKKDY